jgi:P pilus assembly chaperone PapD
MNMPAKYISIMLRSCIIILGMWSPAVLAQTLQIMPVTLGMPHGASSNTLFITNRGAEAEIVQARPFLWSQSSGSDVLSPTDALVVSPPMTSIAPGATQVFRILLQQQAEKVEVSYRILFDELPRPVEDLSGVRLALRLSVPVFALPEFATRGGTSWTVLVGETGAFLHAENNGVQHSSSGVEAGPGRQDHRAVGGSQLHPRGCQSGLAAPGEPGAGARIGSASDGSVGSGAGRCHGPCAAEVSIGVFA